MISMWVDEENNKRFSHLWEAGVVTIENAEVLFFKFRFPYKMTPQQVNSILLWWSQHEHPIGLEILDFVQWMWDRKIPFKLGWRWNGKGLIPNIKTFFFIQGMKIKILFANLRRRMICG